MNLNYLKGMYNNSPYFIKRIYSIIPFSIRNGKTYRQWRSKLKENKLEERSPLSIVEYGYNTFQLYKDLYKDIDINNWEDIPLIDKSITQEYLNDFENFQCSKFYVTTGGVTGKPAKFFQSSNVWFKELAFVYNYFLQHGYKSNMKKASFRGGDFSKLNNGEFYLINPNYNEVHFSPFHLNKDTVKKYVNELNRIKPKYFHGYPSVFITLGKLMQSEGLKLDYKPNTFFLISEGFKQKDINFLRDFFSCNISSFYGHSERLVFAVGDEELKSYVPNPNYGYFELVDKNGKVIKENNIVGEIVGTSYDNFAMPLIRYKTGDYTSYIDYNSKRFGPIIGKWGQMNLTGFNSEEVTLTALNLHSDELDNILKVQFIQEKKGEVLMKIMFSDDNYHDLKAIERLLTKRVGEVIKFKVELTERFQLNARGKAPLIINNIN